MDTIRDLRKALAKARTELKRAEKAFSTCLITSDHAGCAAEQEAKTAAERRVHALEHRLAEAERVAQRQAMQE